MDISTHIISRSFFPLSRVLSIIFPLALSFSPTQAIKANSHGALPVYCFIGRDNSTNRVVGVLSIEMCIDASSKKRANDRLLGSDELMLDMRHSKRRRKTMISRHICLFPKKKKKKEEVRPNNQDHRGIVALMNETIVDVRDLTLSSDVFCQRNRDN